MFLKKTCLVVVCCLACLMSFSTGVEGLGRLGLGRTEGLSSTKTATAEIQTMVTKVRPAVEIKVGHTFGLFNAISFRSQVMSGTNFFVKVHVGGKAYVHLKITRSVHGKVSLGSYKTGLSRAAPILVF